ncbi:MAG TPA: ComF family protein [Casimicrobiaceae bacterium]|nr:ComF family protein [Casimicrobiaceae bacterium]
MLSNREKWKFDNAHAMFGEAIVRVGDACRALLPPRCALCAAPCTSSLLCASCTADMPVVEPACPRCALATPDASTCGRCLAAPPPYASTVAAWRYAFPVDRLLQRFKYGGDLALAEPLGDALARAVVVRGERPDAIVAMPLSRARQRHRGFNHAHEIARRVARVLDVPQDAGLVRTRDAPPQAGLAWRERKRNVRGAFVASRCEGRTVAIIDDVMTTGATLDAAARAVLSAGARRVDAWVVARTPPPEGAVHRAWDRG